MQKQPSVRCFAALL